jgi:hypothetical protein
VLLLIWVYFGIGCAVYITAYESIDLPALRAPAFAAQVMFAAIVGAVSYRIGAEGPWFGYATKMLPRLPVTPRWSSPVRLGVLATSTAAILVNLYLMHTGNFGYRAIGEQHVSGAISILGYVGDFGKIALVVGCYYWFVGAALSSIDKAIIVSLSGVLFASAVLSGMKESVLELLIFSAVTYVATGHLLKIKVLVPAAVLIATVFALNPYYRTALLTVGTNQSRLTAASQAIDLMMRQGTRQNANVVGTGGEHFLRRVSLFGFMLPVVEKTPSVYDYRLWERYPALLPTAVIPRVLWPEKPLQDQSSDFNRMYITDTGNSTTPTTIGWAYMEDGLLGVVILMGILGATARFIQEYSLRRHGASLAAVVMFAIAFRQLWQLEGDPYWILNGLIKEFLAAGVAYWAMIFAPRIAVVRRPLRRSVS